MNIAYSEMTVEVNYKKALNKCPVMVLNFTHGGASYSERNIF